MHSIQYLYISMLSLHENKYYDVTATQLSCLKSLLKSTSLASIWSEVLAGRLGTCQGKEEGIGRWAE